MIKIYGHSDDLIEIEGDIEEEFDCYDGENMHLLFSNGMIIKVTYDGEWFFNVVKEGAPGSCTVNIETIPEGKYSQIVNINNATIKWIGFTTHHIAHS